MAKGLNLCMFIGRSGKDPETTYLPSGTALTKFGLAVSYKPKEGEEQTEWVNCVAFGKTAEVVSEHVHKGDLLHVAGRLQTRKYKTKEGVEKLSVEVVLSDVTFLGSSSKQTKETKPRKEATRPHPVDDEDENPY